MDFDEGPVEYTDEGCINLKVKNSAAGNALYEVAKHYPYPWDLW